MRIDKYNIFCKHRNKSHKRGWISYAGFTLVELLIVIAIIGVLASVLLVAINPFEQFNRAKDAGAISDAVQVYRAALAAYTANGQVIAADSSYGGQQPLVNTGDLRSLVKVEMAASTIIPVQMLLGLLQEILKLAHRNYFLRIVFKQQNPNQMHRPKIVVPDRLRQNITRIFHREVNGITGAIIRNIILYCHLSSNNF